MKVFVTPSFSNMVKIGLQIKAILENCTGLRPEDEDFRWYLKLRCGNCGDTPDHWQYITSTESHSLKGGRGEASCVVKCKLCSRENSIDILKDTVCSYDYCDSVNNKFKTIATFECRGLEPIGFSPRNGWTIEGFKVDEEDEDDSKTTGTIFSDVDLSEKEWADFDERSNLSTTISDFEVNFIKVK